MGDNDLSMVMGGKNVQSLINDLPPEQRFQAGVMQGVAQAGADTAKGLASLAKAIGKKGYAIATDPAARDNLLSSVQSAWNTAKDTASYVNQNPGALADAARQAAADLKSYVAGLPDDVQQAYKKAQDEALAKGMTQEQFDGSLVGQVGFYIATAALGGEVADAAKATEAAADAGEAVKAAQGAAKAAEAGSSGVCAECAYPKAEPAATPPVPAVRTEVRNGYTYTLDDAGRTTRVQGELVSNPGQGRNPQAQLKAGGADRLKTDEGGHFIGRRFDGPLDDFNHFAQNMNLNRGAYKVLENSWQRAINKGSTVTVDIAPRYDGSSLRPTALTVKYTVDGVPYKKVFWNRRGG